MWQSWGRDLMCASNSAPILVFLACGMQENNIFTTDITNQTLKSQLWISTCYLFWTIFSVQTRGRHGKTPSRQGWVQTKSHLEVCFQPLIILKNRIKMKSNAEFSCFTSASTAIWQPRWRSVWFASCRETEEAACCVNMPKEAECHSVCSSHALFY